MTDNTLRPFLLFRGSGFYPAGGWLDYVGAYASLDDACSQTSSREIYRVWRHVVDIRTGHVVFIEPKYWAADEVDQEYHLQDEHLRDHSP